MREIIAAILSILYESTPFLLLGFALAGVIHVAMQRFPRITAQLTGSGPRPVFMAALIGAPMPLCSCSVVPAALALRRQGASKGATASFLVSVPETDVVSVLVTLALMGPMLAIYRPVAAVVGALATGFAVRWFENRETRRAERATAPSPAASSCCEPGVKHHAGHASLATRPWWSRVLHYGFVEMFDDIVPQLFLGIVLAGAIGVWLPTIDPGLVHGGGLLPYLVMAAIGIPLYVCASASTPIAAGLIAGGVSPGAAMVFLLAGPATNLASVVVLRSEFGTRILFVYLASIAVASVAAGVLLDQLVSNPQLAASASVHHHAHATPLQIACTVVFLAWIIVSAYRSRLLPRMWVSLTRAAGRLSPR